MGISDHIRRERLLEAVRGYLALEMPEQALRELRAIDDKQHCLFEFHQLRGEAYRQKEDFYEALVEFGKALLEKPTDLSILMGMAWCYKRTERLPLAIEAMQQAYQSCPEEPVVLYNMACYFALFGNKTQALSWLGRSLRLEQSLRKAMADDPSPTAKSLRDLIADETDFDGLRDDPDFQFVAGIEYLSDTKPKN